MKLVVTQRHFVGNEETYQGYLGITDRTLDIKPKKPDIEFKIRLGLKPGLEEQLMGKTLAQSGRLASAGVQVVLNDLGAGDAWLSAMTDVIGTLSSSREKAKDGYVTVLVDGDQFNVNDARVIGGIEHLAERVSKENHLLGLCQRDRVSLAADKYLDQARQVEEMYHALFMLINAPKTDVRRLTNPNDIDLSQAPAAYTNSIDPIPGIYAINPLHSRFGLWAELLRSSAQNGTIIRLVGLGDTIGVMQAAAAGMLDKDHNIPTVAIPTRGNPPGAFKIETIDKKSAEIGKTNLGLAYANVAHSRDSFDYLTNYYPEEIVTDVRNRIANGIDHGIASRAVT